MRRRPERAGNSVFWGNERRARAMPNASPRENAVAEFRREAAWASMSGANVERHRIPTNYRDFLNLQ
jgi:hypothetical protein